MAAKLRLAAAWLTLLSAGFEGQQALGGQQGGSSGPPWLRLAALPAAAAQPTINLDSLGPAGLSARQLWEGLCSSGAPQVSVVEKTIGGAHADMLAGRLTCSSLVAAYLQRIAALDQRMQLNSIRAVHPAAVRRAAQLDGQLAEARVRGAGALPPLFCVPLLVKDNIDVRGLATTAGKEAAAEGPRLVRAWPHACLAVRHRLESVRHSARVPSPPAPLHPPARRQRRPGRQLPAAGCPHHWAAAAAGRAGAGQDGHGGVWFFSILHHLQARWPWLMSRRIWPPPSSPPENPCRVLIYPSATHAGPPALPQRVGRRAQPLLPQPLPRGQQRGVGSRLRRQPWHGGPGHRHGQQRARARQPHVAGGPAPLPGPGQPHWGGAAASGPRHGWVQRAVVLLGSM
jgi:hypothetical protein